MLPGNSTDRPRVQVPTPSATANRGPVLSGTILKPLPLTCLLIVTVGSSLSPHRYPRRHASPAPARLILTTAPWGEAPISRPPQNPRPSSPRNGLHQAAQCWLLMVSPTFPDVRLKLSQTQLNPLSSPDAPLLLTVPPGGWGPLPAVPALVTLPQ